MRIRTFGIGIFCGLVFSVALLAQESETTESVQNALGNDAPYVTVYRKNHPQGGGTKVYEVDLYNFQERVYLIGTNSATNPSTRYMYALDDVELITFPISDYKEPKRLTVQEISELTVGEQIAYLENDASREKHVLERARKRIENKQKTYARLEREFTQNDDAVRQETIRAEMEIIEEELKFQLPRLKDHQQRYDKQYLNYLRKRRNAILAGEIE